MDYRYRVFLEVAENLSFSRAAQNLFISQPAVSKHIRELEKQLGIALFKRKGNRVYLTKAGETVYKYNKRAEQIYNEMKFALGELKNEHTGHLRIGASSTISQYVIPGVLAGYHRKYPKIELSLVSGNSFEIEELLSSGKIDVALVENHASRQELTYRPFLDDEIVCIASAGSIYGKRESISKVDLLEIPVVLREKGSGSLEVIEAVLRENGILAKDLNVFLHLGSTESIKHFLIDFQGIALVSEKAVKMELGLKILKKIKIKNLAINRSFRTAVPMGTPGNFLNNFMDFLYNYNF